MDKKLKIKNPLLNFLKKNHKKMIEDEIINYKQAFTGQQFQWIKTTKLELLGKVVTCRDVDFSGGLIMAFFDDGSKHPADRVGNDLLMITGEMQPLTQMEVESIAGPTIRAKKTESTVKKVETPKIQVPQREEQRTCEPIKVNPFNMFNSDSNDLNITVKIKLPDKKLLKLMYNSAENKEEFLNQLSDYVYSQINNNVVKDSLKKMLDASTSTKPKQGSSDIQLTEIENDKR
jgi:hypothetical protein